VLAVIICIVLVAALIFYAMYRSKPGRLKLSATLLKLASFTIEVEALDERTQRELPTKADDPDNKPAALRRMQEHNMQSR